MLFHLITLFPEACDAYLSVSILGRARKEKKIVVKYQTPRDFVAPTLRSGSRPHSGVGNNKWGKVDERPYGGEPGMVMSALPVVKAVEAALKSRKPFVAKPPQDKSRKAVIWFSPSGKQFTNKDADALAKCSDVVLVCGRYEGIDERAKKILKTLAQGSPGRRLRVKEFAVGEAVYTGGEVPALAIVDAVTRRLPGVLGKDASVEERRVASRAVYTRPETILYKGKKYKVPAVLKTGHHKNIDKWRENK